MNSKVLFIAIGVVLIQGLVAWFEGNFTPGQMAARGFSKNLPFVFHGGMWGDLLFMAPILAIVATYRPFSGRAMACALIVSFTITVAMHLAFIATAFVENHMIRLQPRDITTSGLLHVIYMSVALAAVFLFYFGTGRVTPAHLVLVTIGLLLHIVASSIVVSITMSGSVDNFALRTTLVCWLAIIITSIWKGRQVWGLQA